MKSDIPSTRILGCRVDKVTMADTIGCVDRFISSGRTHQIVVVNVAKIILAMKDQELARIIDEASLVGADGVPVVWSSRLLGDELPERINGTDLMEILVAHAAEKGYSIFFFGAQQDVLDKTVDTFVSQYPDLRIAGKRNGYFSEQENDAVIQQIRGSEADILFIAISSPFKEKWVNDNLDRLGVGVCHGVGGSFDVIAGLTKRAPVWMQRSGLEWLFRVAQEPRRLIGRYVLTNSRFLWLLGKELMRTGPSREG
jgi:N-acetylglucosaminyldiphosphoundecaprenol N-acetyl-beta-D-mannosaminyltransferase